MQSSIYNVNDYTWVIFILHYFLSTHLKMLKALKTFLQICVKEDYCSCRKGQENTQKRPQRDDKHKGPGGIMVRFTDTVFQSSSISSEFLLCFSSLQKDMGRNQKFKSNKKHLSHEHMNV